MTLCTTHCYICYIYTLYTHYLHILQANNHFWQMSTFDALPSCATYWSACPVGCHTSIVTIGHQCNFSIFKRYRSMKFQLFEFRATLLYKWTSNNYLQPLLLFLHKKYSAFKIYKNTLCYYVLQFTTFSNIAQIASKHIH